ncbi:hypothetical protein K6119_15350 [Paracrocinitomix mangrovi]|uniref:hypothetical protein n=1 Tax=Paracrocinitomix mangrovi TaxID=2862509 RepID=UPI001C8EF037|nr:hypothetical protein [Paracrocinitomix mangrovi]UKN01104.1 hypothetical protein K6119_15350 [Paracrocinitomix mangrovi]
MKVKTKIVVNVSTLMMVWLFLACFKSEEYPLEPIILDASAVVYGDSAMVSFDFTDGDADLGLPVEDTTGIHHPDSFYYNNIYLEYYEKDDNLGWVKGLNLSGDTIVFGYRIKPLEVSSNTKGIKGRIDVMVSPQYRNITSSQSDTVKFVITLIDRALNQSNKFETPELIAL